jgi:hypothetical protein
LLFFSVLTCLALAATAGGSIAIVLPLLVLVQITSFADVGALGAGAVSAADPAQRGAALALYALAGFATGSLSPIAVGTILDLSGGATNARRLDDRVPHDQSWICGRCLGSLVRARLTLISDMTPKRTTHGSVDQLEFDLDHMSA